MSDLVKDSRFRNFMYCSNEDSLPSWAKDNKSIKNYLDFSLPNDCEYAFIWHDKDVYTKEQEQAIPSMKAGTKRPNHLHISMNFKSGKSLTSVAKLLEVKPNFIEIFKENNARGITKKSIKQNLFGYLCHMTPSAIKEGKASYDPKEVIANFDYVDFVNATKNSIDSRTMDRNLLIQKILTGKLTKYDFIINDKLSYFYCQNSSNKALVENCCQMRFQRLMNTNNEGKNVNVIFVEGESGSGKTTWAKKFAEKNYKNYYVTSASNDPLQDYAGQRCVIFDDARPSNFEAADWLKMLDPYNNQTSCKSRFYNKYLAVDCIILTSIENWFLFFFYAKFKGSVDETMEQFYRRFHYVVHVDNGIWDCGELTTNVSIYRPFRDKDSHLHKILRDKNGSPNDDFNIRETFETFWALELIEKRKFCVVQQKKEKYNQEEFTV